MDSEHRFETCRVRLSDLWRSAWRQNSRCLGAPTAGTSLIEVLISVGIMAIIMAVGSEGWVKFQAVMNRRDAVSEAQAQISVGYDRVTKYWGQRARPLILNNASTNPYTAVWPGFTINSAAQVVLWLANDQSQWVAITTSCAPVTKAKLQAIDFTSASMCVACGVGQAPIVKITTGGLPNSPFLQLPAGNAGSTKTALSLSACFQPWTYPNALAIDFQAATLDPAGKLSIISKVVDLPLDNFAGVDITQ